MSDIKPELTSLRTKLVLEIEKDTRIRDGADKRIKKNDALLQAVKGALGAIDADDPATNGASYGSKAQQLRTAIGKLPNDTFGISDVEKQLLQLGTPFKKAVLRTGLWTLANKGEIALIKKGTNQSPAEYGKVLHAGTGVFQTKFHAGQG
jgi:hypothetical protein